LNFSGFEHYDLQQYGEEIAYTVRKSTGIPISIGFAETKTLAKAANRIAKKYPERTKGVYLLDDENKRNKALRWLKVEDVWGIGRQHSRKLQAQGIHTAYDFCDLADEVVRKKMGIVGLRMKRELQGIPTLTLETKKAKKNIATTRSFEKRYTTLDQLRERVATFAVSCAEKLRRQKSCCQSLMVFIHTNGFRKDLPQYSRNIVIKLPYATSSSIEITQYALKGLHQIFKEGYEYKKAGVIIMDFCPEEQVQQTLFESSNPKHKVLMDVMDHVNQSIGQAKIKLGIQDRDRVWKMKQEKLSPRYTTKLHEIITVHAK